MTIETTDSSGAEEASSADSALAAPLVATPEVATLNPSEPVHFDLLDRLGKLEEALLARDPMMKTHLGAIHKVMIQHEELVHLLTDEQIGQIVGAQQSHTNTSLLVEVTSKAGKTKAANRTAKLGLDDL